MDDKIILSTVAESISVFKVKTYKKKDVTFFVIGESHSTDCVNNFKDDETIDKWCVSRDALMQKYARNNDAIVFVEGSSFSVNSLSKIPIARFRRSFKCQSNPKCLLFDYRDEFWDEMTKLFLKIKWDTFKDFNDFLKNTTPHRYVKGSYNSSDDYEYRKFINNERFNIENIKTPEEYLKQYYWFLMPLIVNHAIFFEQSWVDNYVAIKMGKLFPDLAPVIIKHFLHEFLHHKIQADYERRLSKNIKVFIVYSHTKLDLLKKYLKNLSREGIEVRCNLDKLINNTIYILHVSEDNVCFCHPFSEFQVQIASNYKPEDFEYRNVLPNRFMNETLHLHADLVYDQKAMIKLNNNNDYIFYPLRIFIAHIPLTDLICALEILSFFTNSNEKFIALYCGQFHVEEVLKLIYECRHVVQNDDILIEPVLKLEGDEWGVVELPDELFKLINVDRDDLIEA